MSNLAVCDNWIETASGNLQCVGTIQYVPYSTLSTFDISQLDPTILASAFGAGFLLLTIFWGAGKGAAEVLRLIRFG